MPSSTHFKELQTLIASLKNPEDLWRIVKQACELIPTESKDSNQDDGKQRVSPEKKRKIVFQFLHKVLKLLPVPPKYTSIRRKERIKYKQIYQLLDKIIPFAAGSSSRLDQLSLLTNR